jgi:hypothetical protein
VLGRVERQVREVSNAAELCAIREEAELRDDGETGVNSKVGHGVLAPVVQMKAAIRQPRVMPKAAAKK